MKVTPGGPKHSWNIQYAAWTVHRPQVNQSHAMGNRPSPMDGLGLGHCTCFAEFIVECLTGWVSEPHLMER